MKEANTLFVCFILSITSVFGFIGSAYAQTEINDEAGLKAISANLSGNYILTADISLTSEFIPLGEFSGTLDGNGHIISGLKFNNTSAEGRGLFTKTNNATIKKLGIENANVIGKKATGAIAGVMSGGVLRECYVANSYIEGEDHVGCLAGRIENNAKIENCYANSYVYTRTTQVGGLVGVIKNSVVSKSYFSGIVHAKNKRANGIVGLVDASPVTIEYCVNLAPFQILENANETTTFFRIIDNTKENVTLTQNYALSTTRLGTSYQTATVVPAGGERVATGKHGANLPDDSNAKSTDFYSQTLQWDFDNTWKIVGDGYPVFKWQSSPVNSSVLNAEPAYSLSGSKTIDLNNLISSHGLHLSFTTDNNKVKIENGVISLNVQIVQPEEVSVKVSGGDEFNIGNITVSLLPSGTITISSPEDLQLINLAPSMTYELTTDIDMTGIVFGGLCTEANPFTGIFDGKGHIIKGLCYNNEETNSIALFRYTDGAQIKNIGFEQADITGRTDVAAIVAVMKAGSIEACYVSNSKLKGSDHTASIAGKVTDGGVIRNCYSNATIKSTKQAGGIAGVILNSKISKCYFSGIAETPADTRRPGGIAALVDASSNSNPARIEYCVNLASYIVGEYNHRIVHNEKEGMQLYQNYSLSTSMLGKTYDIAKPTVTSDSNYGTTGLHGANIPGGDENAKAQTFYQETLNWDFDTTWKMLDDGYPVLMWQSAPVKFSIIRNLESYTLSEGTPVEVNNLISTHGLNLYFTSDNDKLIIEGNKISLNTTISESEKAIIKIIATNSFDCLDSINVKLLSGSGVLAISTPQDLVDASLYPNLSLILKNDINMAGVAFTPIGTEEKPFTGTFDGSGFVILGLNFENTEADYAGLIGYARGATIKDAGLENCHFIANKGVGTYVGNMHGGTIENCYVSASYVEGCDNVGGIAGVVAGNATIKNSFSSSEIKARESNAGGIAGIISNGHIENCYASGKVSARDRSGGIVALLEANESDETLNSLKNCLNLTSELSGVTQYPQRIIWTFGRAMTLANNYSLRNTLLSKGTEQYKIDESESYYGVNNPDGANIPKGDERAKANPFYETELNWDFNEVWTFDKNFEYPVLKLFSTEPETRGDIPSELKKSIHRNLNYYVSGNTLFLDNVPDNSTVMVYSITGSKIIDITKAPTSISISLPSEGLYIVHMKKEKEDIAFKVIIK